MSELPDLPAGVYRHYKGPLYLVLGYGHDANDEARTVVIYVGLQFDGAKSGARLAVRTADDFFAFVHRKKNTKDPWVECSYSGCTILDSEHRRRFTYLGPVAPNVR